MAKEGKKGGIGRIVLIVVVVLVVAGAIGSMGGGSNGGSDDSSASGGEQTQQQGVQGNGGATSGPEQTEPQEPYTVTNEELDTSNPYAVYIKGTLTNNTDNELSYVQVEYNLYDADGAQIGTALANVNNLQAGGVWKFEAIGTADSEDVASFELMDVTGF